MELLNKIFAVSGAASGLGKATAELFLREGARVIAMDISDGQKGFDSMNNRNVEFYKCDVRSPEQISESISSGVSHFGGLHGAVACAGIAPAFKMHSSRSGSHSYQEFLNTLEINLGGTFNLFNACIPYLKDNQEQEADNESGVLIATSSVAASEGQIGQAAYAASKGGVSSMVLPMARELARSGIRVIAIAPGIFRTPMVDSFPQEVQESLVEEVVFPHRLGQPHEFAELVLHIITNRYINGTVIRLDGGVRMGGG